MLSFAMIWMIKNVVSIPDFLFLRLMSPGHSVWAAHRGVWVCRSRSVHSYRGCTARNGRRLWFRLLEMQRSQVATSSPAIGEKEDIGEEVSSFPFPSKDTMSLLEVVLLLISSVLVFPLLRLYVSNCAILSSKRFITLINLGEQRSFQRAQTDRLHIKRKRQLIRIFFGG